MIHPDQIDGSFAPTVDPAVASIELDGEAVLYHEASSTVHVLNSTATIIWGCIDGRTDLDTMCGELADVFYVDVEVVRTDVITAVRELGRQGLLVDVQPDPEVVAANRLDPGRPSSFIDEPGD